MPPRITLNVALGCCGKEHAVTFDHDDCPVLPFGSYRTNLTCSGCQKLVIITMREGSGDDREISQEILA